MAKPTMAEEIALLRDELDRLQKVEAESVHTEVESDGILDALVDGAQVFEGDLESKAQEILEQMKIDYENMSPATAVAIFSAGALFGRLFLSK